MKQCSKCREFRDESEFHKRRDKPIGLRPDCRHCQRKRVRCYANKVRTKRYYRDPVMKSAHQKVRDAVRAGKLSKPSCCQQCGKQCERRKLSGHHHNGYSNALDVVWLCHVCHAKEHSFK